MSDQLLKSQLKMWKDLLNVTSSLVLGDGRMHSDSREYPTTCHCGQAHHHVNHSVLPDHSSDSLTLATSPPHSCDSLTSADLQLLLGNKLRLQLANTGSTIYSLNWKDKTTPAHRRYCQLVASVPRIKENDCSLGSWPTPTTRDHKGGYQGGRIRNGKLSVDTLDVAAQLVGWLTRIQ
jgi:hypothetical protein